MSDFDPGGSARLEIAGPALRRWSHPTFAMPHGTVSQVVLAPSAAVFELLHDYGRRLQWDTLLSAAYLDDGFTAACKGATSVCVGRWHLGRIALKTEYVAFDPPRLAAVKMVNRPPLFESWAASILHEDLGDHSSRVTYTWTFTARPRRLRWLLEPLMNRLFHAETRKRLAALAAFFAVATAHCSALDRSVAAPSRKREATTP